MICSAYGCMNRSSNAKLHGVTFHSFPTDEMLRKVWTIAVRRKDFVPNEHSRLCSEHFEEDCFYRFSSSVRIKENAIPTIFKGFPEHLQDAAKNLATVAASLISEKHCSTVPQAEVLLESLSQTEGSEEQASNNTSADLTAGNVIKVINPDGTEQEGAVLEPDVIAALNAFNQMTDGATEAQYTTESGLSVVFIKEPITYSPDDNQSEEEDDPDDPPPQRGTKRAAEKSDFLIEKYRKKITALMSVNKSQKKAIEKLKERVKDLKQDKKPVDDYDSDDDDEDFSEDDMSEEEIYTELLKYEVENNSQ